MKTTAPRKPDVLIVSVVILCLLLFESFYLYYVDFTKLSKATGDLKLRDAHSEIDSYNNLDIDASFSLRYSVPFESTIRIVALPIVMPLNSFRAVCVYFDDGYPTSGLGLREWIGLKDHIPIELEKVGIPSKIIGADELRELMLREADTPIIIPSGALPDTVYDREGGLVCSWLERGGVLFWAGYKFGYEIAYRNGTLGFVGASGQRKLLGYELGNGNLSSPDAVADNWTGFARGLALSYAHAWVGPNLDNLVKHGGLALGAIYRSKEGPEYSSISLVQNSRGQGRIVIFGGGIGYAGSIMGEDSVARDIAKILWSGLPFSRKTFYRLEGKEPSAISPAIGYMSCQVKGQGTLNDTLRISRVTRPHRDQPITSEVILLVFSLSPYSELYMKQISSFSIDGSGS